MLQEHVHSNTAIFRDIIFMLQENTFLPSMIFLLRIYLCDKNMFYFFFLRIARYNYNTCDI